MSALAIAKKALADLQASADYKSRQKISPPPGFARTRLGMVERGLLSIIAELSPVTPTLTPPAPKPVPPLLQGKMLFALWGISNGQFTAAQLADYARQNGYAKAVLEADDYGNDQLLNEWRLACQVARVYAGIWETSPAPELKRWEWMDFYLAEVESPGDCQALLDGPTPTVPHAVVTNFNGLDAAKAQALRDKGYLCMAESVLPENPSAVPEKVIDYASRVLGWPLEHVIPVVYLNGDKTLADYGDLGRWSGYGVWSAEYVYG